MDHRSVEIVVGKRPDLMKEIFGVSSGIFQRFQGFFSEILSSLSVASRLKRRRKSQVAEVSIPDQNTVVCFA